MAIWGEAMKEELRVGTEGWETTVANEDIKKKVINRELPTWNNPEQIATKTLEFLTRSDCVVLINGHKSTIPSGVEYQPEGYIYTFETLTADIEYYLSMTF